MHGLVPTGWLGLLLLVTTQAVAADAVVVHHAMQVRLDPDRHEIRVEDTLTLPAEIADTKAGIPFSLHAGLAPHLEDKTASLTRLGTESEPVPVEHYRLTLPAGVTQTTLCYAGRIHHPLSAMAEGRGRTRHDTAGLIDPGGVYLDGSSDWYPRFEVGMVSFSMTVEAPPGWHAVSQGREEQVDAQHVVWTETQPQDDIYLVAGRFQVYRRPTPFGEAQVYLRHPDPELAERYLKATAEYLSLYSDLLGPYPYAKFALVENFWESGYGMPSFTLLGPSVIRLPFIIHTSYPHEILHNWWGNGVYVDYGSGNWAEGLTSYLADHLLQEQQGRGADYRRAALQKYLDYVARENDFPLTAFRARHGEVSRAVGYSKALMFFHMLRRRLGDEQFLAGLRRFYQDNRFRVVGFADLRRALEQASGEDLSQEFAQWVERTGAPALRIRGVRVEQRARGYRIDGTLEQTQAGPAYALAVPVVVQLAGGATYETTIPMSGKRGAFTLDPPARPLRLLVDPRFDLFRRLDRREVPPSLDQLFGSDKLLLVLPAGAPRKLRDAYRALATGWAGRDGQVVWDRDLEALPRDRPVWLMGWKNRLLGASAKALQSQGITLGDGEVTRAGERLAGPNQSVVLVARHPGNAELALGWLASNDPAAFPGLARKLPHYGKYSYLVFNGEGPTNTLKGQWQVQDSPLSVVLAPGPIPPLKLAPRPALSAVARARPGD